MSVLQWGIGDPTRMINSLPKVQLLAVMEPGSLLAVRACHSGTAPPLRLFLASPGEGKPPFWPQLWAEEYLALWYLLYPSSFFCKCAEQNSRPRIGLSETLVFVFSETCLGGGPEPKVSSLTYAPRWWIRKQCPLRTTKGETLFFHLWMFKWLSMN